jgi:glycosyltransferase involved in cell wall biosynthesis
MKILLVTGIFPPDIGGPATYIPNLARYLMKKGHEVRILTLANDTKNQLSDEFQIIRIQRKLPKPLRMILVIALITLTPKDFKIFANGLHEEVGLSLALRKRHALAKIVGDPVWERSRNIGSTKLNIVDFNMSKQSLKARVQRKLIAFSLNRFTGVTAPSLELCSLIASWKVKKKITYLANGTNVKVATDKTKHHYDLICISRLVSWKNIKIHIDIANEIGMRLAIVGTGPEEKDLKSYAKLKNCEVTFLGERDKSQIESLLIQSKVFIMMSEYEGLSFSLLEAMSLGLPAIVSDIPSNTSVIRNGEEGIVLEIDNWQSRVPEIKELFKNEQKYQLYSNNVKERIHRDFNEEKQFANTEKLLDLR